MLNQERGYSFVMWTATFAVVIAGIAICFVPVKRALTSQVMHTTDHAVWGLWANQSKDDVRQDGGRNWNQIDAVKTNVSQDIHHQTKETPSASGSSAKIAIDSQATSEYSTTYSTY